MPIPAKLTIDLTGLDSNRLLADWRWIVPDDFNPIELTVFGDWFFEDSGGAVHFLDLVGGELTRVAQSRAEFAESRQLPENLAQWYMADLARSCFELGIRLPSGQCLSYKIPPVLSGKLEPENIEVCDLMVHETIMGQIHRQTRCLPEGTQIRRFLVDGEEP